MSTGKGTTANIAIDIPPPSISGRDIKKTIEADVVVVGAGVSGLTAALSAAESGARVILLEKGDTYHFRGLHNAALSSRLQKQNSVEIDRDRVMYTIMEFAAYRNDQRLVKTWADNCDSVMDWLLDMAEAAGNEVILDTTTKPWYFPNYPIIHVFRPKQQETLVSMLLQNAESRGAEVWWKTPGVRLLREGQGRVTGIIARDASGDYLQFNARRGVVLCTGDYGHNRQLVEWFLPEITHDLRIVYEPDVNTGDGHLMGLWAGAAIDDAPHCAMLWDFAHFSDTGLFNLARQPWLYVNTNGERFMNEDLPYGYECNQMLQQPERHAWAVWDAKYDDEWPKMQSQCCKNMGPPTYLWNPRQLEEALEKGNVVTAPSIPELAARMNVPADAFQATVDRYNELARGNYDADFGKHPSRLTTLEKPLYYATIMQVRRMVILSGLKINTRMQVMDTGRMPIPGLFAAGNTSGGFFANAYPTTVPGLTHSRAWTFGRLAGQNAAAGI